ETSSRVALLTRDGQRIHLIARSQSAVAAGVDREGDVLTVRLLAHAVSGARDALQGRDLLVELSPDLPGVDLLEVRLNCCECGSHWTVLSCEWCGSLLVLCSRQEFCESVHAL